MATCDAFVIVDEVQFIKRGPLGWINRNRIRTPSGWQWLTVPVIDVYKQRIIDTKIDNSKNWQNTHARAIQWNYKTARYFKQYSDAILEAYQKEWEYLSRLNIFFIKRLAEILGIKTPIYLQSEMGISGKASGLIVDICKKTGADTYLSGVHGKDYLDEQMVEQSGVKLVYQEFIHPRYPQCHKGDFVENLSIIDLIFNCGKDSLELLLGKKR
jgi:hypothetical protein